jgi:hypothetical protein
MPPSKILADTTGASLYCSQIDPAFRFLPAHELQRDGE